MTMLVQSDEDKREGEREHRESLSLVLRPPGKGTVWGFLPACLTLDQQEGAWCRWTLKSSVTFRVCVFNCAASFSALL